MRWVAVPVLVLVLAASALRAQGRQARTTIAGVRFAQQLACGVVQEDAEYSSEDDHASRGGFDEAICKAVALAVGARMGSRSASQLGVAITTFRDETSALAALRAGNLEMVATVSADAAHRVAGVAYTRPVFYDSLALLVPVADGAHRPEELAGKKICVLAETGTEDALRGWFGERHVDYLPFPFQEEGEMEAAYITHNCAALAGERTRLSLIRLSLGEAAAQHAVLAEPLSRDPMSCATRAHGARWSRVVDLVVGMLLTAEQLGLTAEQLGMTAETTAAVPANGEAAQFLRRTRVQGAALGLRPTWAVDVLRGVGNYGEIYARTLGSGSDRGLPRD